MMIFDLSFLDLELEAARTGAVPSQLLTHPTFDAIARHEAALPNRPVWDEDSFRARFAAAASGDTQDYHDWGLAPLFHSREALEKWLSEKAGHRVYIHMPQRGEKWNLLELARKNAQLTLNQFGERMRQEEKRTQGAMQDLVRLLGIEDEEMPPSRIEAYDISNTYGFLSVGSMVVFENGRPLKNDYRKFRIQTVYGANDYASMQEVLRRRFSHAFRELKERQEAGKDIALGKFTHLPDLILMDGGKGQVHVAEEVLREFELDIPVAGMVKDDRHRTRGLYYHDQEVDLAGHDEVFHLVTRIQDEAHRFAITYHKKLRAEDQIQSVLEQIPGIGPARRKALISAFGSVEAIQNKEEEELAQVAGMTAASARAVYEFFHKNPEEA